MVCMIAPTMGIFLHFLSCDCVVYYVVLIFWLHCHKVYFLVVFRLGFLCFFSTAEQVCVELVKL